MASLTNIRTGTLLVIALLVLAVLGPANGAAPPPLPQGQVRCALPPVHGNQGHDGGFGPWGPPFFALDFQALGAVDNLQAELLAYDTQGDLLFTIPNVQNGAVAQLLSNTNPHEWQYNPKHGNYQVFAPLPVLHAFGTDHGTGAKLEAFCSLVPYVELLTPVGIKGAPTSCPGPWRGPWDGPGPWHGRGWRGCGQGATSNPPPVSVISASESQGLHVFATLPLVNVAKLQILVDGTNIAPQLLAALGHPLASCTVAAPCAVSGITLGSGATITVANLVVSVAPNLQTYAANTLAFDLQGASCGAHQVTLQGWPGPWPSPPGPPGPGCFQDDLTDTGFASVFSIAVTSPTDGQTGLSFPVEVTGEACAGLPISTVNINGHTVTGSEIVACPTSAPAGTSTVCFDAKLNQTDLKGDVTGTVTALGTFDPGTNYVLASATDTNGNRTFDKVLFATGTPIKPGIPAAAQALLATPAGAALQQQVQQQLQQRLGPILPMLAPETVTMSNAFQVGITQAAVQKIFNAECPVAAQAFKANAEPALLATTFPSSMDYSVDPTCSTSCSASPTITAATVNLGTESCTATFQAGNIHVTMNLPTVDLTIQWDHDCGDCDVGHTKTKIHLKYTGTLSGTTLEYDIPPAQLLPTATTPPVPTTAVGSLINQKVSGSVDTPCFISGLCEFAIDVVTLGVAELAGVFDTGSIDVSLKNTDLQNAIDGKADPIQLNKIQVDPGQIASAGVSQNVSAVIAQVSDIQISPQGLLATLQGTFQVPVPDPSIPVTPGANPRNPQPLTIADILAANPTFDVFMGLNDDTLNMLFAGMAMGGGFKANCSVGNPAVHVADLLPADCSTLVDTNNNPPKDTVTDTLQGACYAIQGVNCATVTGPTQSRTAFLQGVCYGASGADCSTLSESSGTLTTVERVACTAAAKSLNLNIHGTDQILFCTQQDIPPAVLLRNDASPPPPAGTVASTVRLNQLSVGLVVDRGNTFVAPTPNTLTLDSFTSCFASGAPTTGDCLLYALCLDVNLDVDMSFITDPNVCPTGTNLVKPGFQFKFKDVQVTNRTPGLVCGGSQPSGNDPGLLNTAQGNNEVTTIMGTNAQSYSPPICVNGILDFGGLTQGNGTTPLFSCATPMLFTLTKGGTPTGFADYLGVSCMLQ